MLVVLGDGCAAVGYPECATVRVPSAAEWIVSKGVASAIEVALCQVHSGAGLVSRCFGQRYYRQGFEPVLARLLQGRFGKDDEGGIM